MFDCFILDLIMFEPKEDFIETMEQLAASTLQVYFSREKADWLEKSNDTSARTIFERGTTFYYENVIDPEWSWTLFRNVSEGKSAQFTADIFAKWTAIEYRLMHPDFQPNVHVSGPSGVINPVSIPIAKGAEMRSLNDVIQRILESGLYNNNKFISRKAFAAHQVHHI